MKLTQRALAARLDRSVSWIHRQGELVTGFALGEGRDSKQAHRETWARAEYSNCRLAYYMLVSKSK